MDLTEYGILGVESQCPCLDEQFSQRQTQPIKDSIKIFKLKG